MAAKDLYHEHVRNALIKDGWTITHDPLQLKYSGKYALADLAAERLLAAEKGAQKIAVEVKSFVGKSSLNDLEKALGQFTLYSDVLEESEPDRILYLAIRESVFAAAADAAYWELLLRKQRLRLVLFNPTTQEVTRWIPAMTN